MLAPDGKHFCKKHDAKIMPGRSGAQREALDAAQGVTRPMTNTSPAAMAHDFQAAKPHAEIYEVRVNVDWEESQKKHGIPHNMIRLYRTYNAIGQERDENGFNFQIFTYKPTNEHRNGKKRHMVATVGMTLGELKQLVAEAEDIIDTK